MRQYFFLCCLLIICLDNFAQNVGIGTPNPQGQFHVSQGLYFSGITYSGTGLNDMTAQYAAYNADSTSHYEVILSNAGPNPNLIKWRISGGSWSSEIPISGSIPLNNDVLVSFNNTTGHTYGDTWTFTVAPPYLDALIVKDGKVGIGTPNPEAKLVVAGKIKTDSLRITGGASNGMVLVSDHLGNAYWGLGNMLSDADTDTRISMKDAPGNNDSILFTLDGTMNWILTRKNLYTENNSNLFFGKHAGHGADPSSSQSIAIGDHALQNNTVRSGLVAIGDSSLYKNGFGATTSYHSSKNTAIGRFTLKQNEKGYGNSALGYDALRNNVDAYNNTAIGSEAMYFNTAGYDNTAIGASNLYKNTLGYNNSSLGSYALYSNTSGSNNTAVGTGSLYQNSTGEGNTATGVYALYSNTTGQYNLAQGVNALFVNSKGSYNIALGTSAMLLNTSAGRNIALGSNALSAQSFSNSNTAWDSDNIAIGYSSLSTNQPNNLSNGIKNIGIGNFSLKTNSQGYKNVAIGDSAMYQCTTGYGNVAVGNSVLNNLTDGHDNVVIGTELGQGITTGDYNVALGNRILNLSTSGSYNTAIGYSSQYSSFGSYNTSIGSSSFAIWNTYSNSTALGHDASITASDQVRIGAINTTSIGGYTGWSNLSDVRFKKDIQHDVPGLDFILNLKPVTYRLDVAKLNEKLGIDSTDAKYGSHLKEANDRKSKEVFTGFIAQEVKAVADSMNFNFSGIDLPKNEDDMYGLRYAEFVVPLVKAVQELNEEIKILREENKLLKEQMTRLENKK